MLKRSIGIVVVAAAGACALAMPAGAKQEGGNRGQAVRVAAATCKQERKDLGRQKFGEEYGKHAMKTCISETTTEAKNAAQECRDERDEMGLDKFREEYGTNHNGRNAFGKCVSEHVNGDDEEPACDSQQPGDEDDGSADGGAADDGSADDGTTDGTDTAAKPHGEHGHAGEHGQQGASDDESADEDESAGEDCSSDDGAPDDDSGDDGAADDGSADDGAAGDAV